MAGKRSVWTSVLIASAIAPSLLAHDRIGTHVSWTRDIEPLVRARCVRCHNPGGRGPMPLITYADARPWARAIREEVLARRMPKWHAARGYGDFSNDPSLSSFEIAMIVAWVDGGSPEDPPRNSPALPVMSPAKAAPNRPSDTREVTLPCSNQLLPAGEVIAIRPRLGPGGSIGMSVLFPSGRREVVAWIRGYEPEFEETYWLRNPIPPRPERRLLVEATAPCLLTLLMK